jgi:hypothetical protein
MTRPNLRIQQVGVPGDIAGGADMDGKVAYRRLVNVETVELLDSIGVKVTPPTPDFARVRPDMDRIRVVGRDALHLFEVLPIHRVEKRPDHFGYLVDEMRWRTGGNS